MIQKPPKKLQKPSNHLQMTFKWLQNGYPGGGGGSEGGGVLLVSTAIGFAIYHITRFNFFWGIISQVFDFIGQKKVVAQNLKLWNFEGHLKFAEPHTEGLLKRRKSRCRIWHFPHSPSNLKVIWRVQNGAEELYFQQFDSNKSGLKDTKCPSNLEVKAPEKWRICNFGSPLPTFQMASRFGGQNSRKVNNL